MGTSLALGNCITGEISFFIEKKCVGDRYVFLGKELKP